MIVLEEDYDTGNLTVRQVSEVSRLCAMLELELRSNRTPQIFLVYRLVISSVWIASLGSCLAIRRICCVTTLSTSQMRSLGKPVSMMKVLKCSSLVVTASPAVISVKTSQPRRL